MVGASEPLGSAELGDCLAELGAVAVGEGVVGQHPLHDHAVGGEERPGPTQEPRAGPAALVGVDLGVGQPGVVVGGGVDELVADPDPAAAVTGRAAVLDRSRGRGHGGRHRRGAGRAS